MAKIVFHKKKLLQDFETENCYLEVESKDMAETKKTFDRLQKDLFRVN